VISTGEIKRGITVEIDGQLYQIVEFQHIKMGRGSAQVRMKLRNVRKGDLIEKTVQAGERFQRARLDHRVVQFMYKDGTHFHFMDTKSYDQIALDADQLGDAVNYLTDGMEVTGATKPATLESGLKVNVPLFVKAGDKIKVDTRTGEYLERA
jgi:elongation factor P